MALRVAQSGEIGEPSRWSALSRAERLPVHLFVRRQLLIQPHAINASYVEPVQVCIHAIIKRQQVSQIVMWGGAPIHRLAGFERPPRQPAIITVGQPATIAPPCAQVSPSRAAGMPPISTVADPLTIVSGGPTHVHIPVAVAAGRPPIKTVGTPGGNIGPPTCGIGGVPGVTIGQVCRSEIRAAGGMPLKVSAAKRDRKNSHATLLV